MQVKQESERHLVARLLRRLTARQVVIAYFACFALGWLGLAAAVLTVGGPRPERHNGVVTRARQRRMLVLGGAACRVTRLEGQRWLAHGARGPLRGLPLSASCCANSGWCPRSLPHCGASCLVGRS
jgi:hypothetical protein